MAGKIGKQLGGWHENVLDVVVVNKKWKALPWGNIGQPEVYRTDWFKEVGVNKFPDGGPHRRLGQELADGNGVGGADIFSTRRT